MIYLAIEQVLFIHSRLVAETGGSHVVRDIGMLKSAIARPRATFDNQELYPDLYSKVAALMDSLIINPPFLDGNEPTGITAAGLFLRLNGRKLRASPSELEEITLRVATEGVHLTDLAKWLAENSRLE